jgi:phospholipid/cholesterol/gamma-HCH transport system ATP-binding protein
MIRLENVSAGYMDREILHDIDLTIANGEIFSIVGRSGSGKSTLLKCIIGFIKPTKGKIYIDGEEIVRLSERGLNRVRRKMGMVFQKAALLDFLDVFSNVAFGLRYNTKLKQDEIRKRVEEVLEAVEMEGTGKLMPSELSGGMQKRVGLARALAENPRIILYDEPTTGLDPVITENINKLILRTREKYGVTSVIISHDIRSVMHTSDRIAGLFDGRITFTGTPDEVLHTKDENLQKFLATINL